MGFVSQRVSSEETCVAFMGRAIVVVRSEMLRELSEAGSSFGQGCCKVGHHAEVAHGEGCIMP